MAKWKEDPQGRDFVEEVTEVMELPIYNASAKGKFRPWLKESFGKLEDTVVKTTSKKQDKEDNNLQTTDKTVVGGINELNNNKLNKNNGEWTGVLATTETKNLGTGEYAIDLKNSCIFGVDSVAFSGTANTESEGLLFLKSGKAEFSTEPKDYDSLTVLDGILKINAEPMLRLNNKYAGLIIKVSNYTTGGYDKKKRIYFDEAFPNKCLGVFFSDDGHESEIGLFGTYGQPTTTYFESVVDKLHNTGAHGTATYLAIGY